MTRLFIEQPLASPGSAKDTSKEVSNSPDYTMRPMYIGDNTDTIMMPQSRSTYVGIRPQPTVIMKSKFDVVSDTRHSRIIHNYSDPPPVGRDFTRWEWAPDGWIDGHMVREKWLEWRYMYSWWMDGHLAREEWLKTLLFLMDGWTPG